MESSLTARLGPMVQVRAVDKFSGSGGEFFLRTNEEGLEIPSAPADLRERLALLGLEATRREARPVDVAAIRSALGMTQEEFAAAFGFSVATIRN